MSDKDEVKIFDVSPDTFILEISKVWKKDGYIHPHVQLHIPDDFDRESWLCLLNEALDLITEAFLEWEEGGMT